MPHANTERVVHNERIGLLVCNEDPELTQARARGWYFEECNVHVCNSRDMFVDYEPVTAHEVILDNNSHVDVVGFGTVMLPLTTGKVLTLENVFHIPTMTKCFISLGKIDTKFRVSFGGGECTINKGRNVIGKGYVEDGLYRLSVLEENSGVKVLHDETISLLVAGESPELIKARARGWVLSNRCTVHVCNSRDMFVDYHPLNGHEVKLEYCNEHVEVAGVGTVKLRLATGKVWTLRNVFHMPKMIKCILSLSKLGESNLVTTWSIADGVLKNGDEVVGTVYREGGCGLFRLSVVDECQDGTEGSEQ